MFYIVGSEEAGWQSSTEDPHWLHVVPAHHSPTWPDWRPRSPAWAGRHPQGGLLVGHGGRPGWGHHHGTGHAQHITPHRRQGSIRARTEGKGHLMYYMGLHNFWYCWTSSFLFCHRARLWLVSDCGGKCSTCTWEILCLPHMATYIPWAGFKPRCQSVSNVI